MSIIKKSLPVNIFNIIILLGSLQGFFLAFVFLTSKKLNRRSNFFLALLLFSLSIVNLANSLDSMGLAEKYPIINYLPTNWSLLIPFSLLYFIRYLINPNYKFGSKEYWLLFPFILQFLFKCFLVLLYVLNSDWLSRNGIRCETIVQVMEGVAIVYCAIVMVISLRSINCFDKQLQNQFADIERRNLTWLKNILIKVVVLWVLWIIPYTYSIIYHKPLNNYMVPLWLGVTLIIYWLGYSMHIRRDIFEFTPPEVLKQEPEEIINETASEKPVKEIPESWEQHYRNLTNLMEKEKLYLDFDINMTGLAEKMGLSNGYLSQIINQKEGLNFYDYINKYRVEEVKKKLADPQFAHLSIYGLALDCGFKSKSTFNLVFKKITGKTPTEYRSSL